MIELEEVAVDADHPVVVATVSGEIDMSNVDRVERTLVRAVPNDAFGLVLDVSGVTYVDSSGIRMLLSLASRLRWHGQEVRIAAPDGGRVRRVLELTGAGNEVAFAPSVDAARASIESGAPAETSDP